MRSILALLALVLIVVLALVGLEVHALADASPASPSSAAAVGVGDLTYPGTAIGIAFYAFSRVEKMLERLVGVIEGILRTGIPIRLVDATGRDDPTHQVSLAAAAK